MHPQHAKAFLGEYPDHRGQQPVVAGKRGAADAGEEPRPFGVRAQVEQRWPAHRADQHQVLAAVLAQGGNDASRGQNPDELMRPRRQDGWIGEAFQTHQEDAAPCGVRRGRDLTWKPAAAGQDAECRLHSARISPRWLGASMNASTSAISGSLP